MGMGWVYIGVYIGYDSGVEVGWGGEGRVFYGVGGGKREITIVEFFVSLGLFFEHLLFIIYSRDYCKNVYKIHNIT